MNIYPVAILFEPNLIHTSRRYGKGRWFDRMFTPIFEDILTLKLLNGFHITHTTIMIVKLTDIWGRYKQPMVHVVQHNHSQEDIDSMWTGGWTVRKALTKVYGTIPMYITHSPVSPQVCSTADLYYREEIRNLKLHDDEDQAADMQQTYNDYLIRHGRPKEVNYLDTPDIDR